MTQKGQVTVPLEIRKKLKVGQGSKVEFVQKNGYVRLKVVPDFFSFRGTLKSKRLPTSQEMEAIAVQEAVGRYKKSFSK